MTVTFRHEDISPALAHTYLGQTAGNRPLETKPALDHVLSLAVAMEQGKWDESASELVFDCQGKLIDGHHRLHAVVKYGGTVRMLVKRGVSLATRGLLDTNRVRTIRDMHVMFRGGVEYLSQRKASLITCIGLVVPGRPPNIRTLDAYDSWMRQFKEGIDAAVNIGRVYVRDGSPGIQTGPVSGAFAFAHKTNPRKVEAFMARVRDGVDLQRDEPAYTLRGLVNAPTRSGLKKNNGGSDRRALARKVLGAIYADLRGTRYGRAQAGEEAQNYFRTAYDTKAIDRLVSLWTHDAVEETTLEAKAS